MKEAKYRSEQQNEKTAGNHLKEKGRRCDKKRLTAVQKLCQRVWSVRGTTAGAKKKKTMKKRFLVENENETDKVPSGRQSDRNSGTTKSPTKKKKKKDRNKKASSVGGQELNARIVEVKMCDGCSRRQFREPHIAQSNDNPTQGKSLTRNKKGPRKKKKLG